MSLSNLLFSSAYAGEGSFVDSIKPTEVISSDGHLIDWLFNYITIMDTFFFVLVCIGLFGFSYKYYYQRNRKPYYTYGNKKIHIMITTLIGVAVFVGIDMNITRMANNDLLNTFWNWPDEEKEDVYRVQVLAQQWMWTFRHAGKDGKFNTFDDVVMNHDLVIPEKKKVVFQLTSKDVIHSFYVPNVRLKIDAIPGRITRIWWDANKAGKYDIACAEMCGTNHYRMQAWLYVKSQSDFDQWLEEAHDIALATNDLENPDSFWGWKWESK